MQDNRVLGNNTSPNKDTINDTTSNRGDTTAAAKLLEEQ